MESRSLEPQFINATTDTTRLRELELENAPETLMRREIGCVDFNTAYDFFRAIAHEMCQNGEADSAIERITAIDNLLERLDEAGHTLDVHTALMQVLTALQLRLGRLSEAMKSAAKALNLLSQSPKRKDEPFLSVLGTLLYDIAIIHYENGEFKQAEREIEKAIKIFERLAKIAPTRYGAAHVTAMEAATHVYRSREKQTEMLASCHETTNECLRQVDAGMEEAIGNLVDSMTKEGETLMKMGRSREALQYYGRAMKYLTKIEPEFTMRQLNLSILLGEALLSSAKSREKGIHLLNTMLHKATKLHSSESHRQIVDILVNAQSHQLDILGIWHKFFPR